MYAVFNERDGRLGTIEVGPLNPIVQLHSGRDCGGRREPADGRSSGEKEERRLAEFELDGYLG